MHLELCFPQIHVTEEPVESKDPPQNPPLEKGETKEAKPVLLPESLQCLFTTSLVWVQRYGITKSAQAKNESNKRPSVGRTNLADGRDQHRWTSSEAFISLSMSRWQLEHWEQSKSSWSWRHGFAVSSIGGVLMLQERWGTFSFNHLKWHDPLMKDWERRWRMFKYSWNFSQYVLFIVENMTWSFCLKCVTGWR